MEFPPECRTPWTRLALLCALVATALLWKWPLLGQTYYPADVLVDFPFWYDGVTQPHNFDLFDAAIQYYPIDAIYHDELHRGRLFQWNPYSLEGHPVFAEGKTGMLYPPRLLLHLLLPAHRAHDVLLWLHLWGAGLAMAWFLGRLGLGPFAQAAGAVTWMLNGVAGTLLEYEYLVVHAAWLPLVLGMLYQGVMRGLPRRLIGAGLVLGLLGYAGMIQYYAYDCLICGLWALFLCGARGRSAPWGWVLASLGLAPLLAAPQLLPMLELVARSQRPAIPVDFHVTAWRQLLAGLLPSLVLPDFAGNPADGLALRRITIGGYWIYAETCVYLGILPLLLAPFGIRFRTTAGWLFFAAFVAAATVVPATPLYGLVLLLPGFARLTATRLVYLWVLGGTVLAAYGAEAILDRPRTARAVGMAGAAAGALLAVAIAVVGARFPSDGPAVMRWLLARRLIRLPEAELYPSPQAFVMDAWQHLVAFYRLSNLALGLPCLYLLLAGALLLAWQKGRLSDDFFKTGAVGLICLDLLIFGIRFNTAVPPQALYPQVPCIAWLLRQPGPYRVMGLRSIKPNTLMPFRVDDVAGYYSVYPATTQAFLNDLENGHPNTPNTPFNLQVFPITNAASPLVDLAGARYVVTYPDVPLPTPHFVRRFDRGMVVYENTQALPRAWIAPQATAAATDLEALASLQQPGVDYRRTVVLTAVPSPAAGGPGVVRDLTEAPGSMQCRVEAASGGWLVFAECDDPGWEADLDGHPATVRAADGIFMAVFVPPGASQVSFHYRSRRLVAGCEIGAVVLLGMLAGLAAAGRA